MAQLTEEAVLRKLLTDATGVTAVVGTRISPMRREQFKTQADAKDYLTYRRVSGLHFRSMGGPSGLRSIRFQIDGYTKKYEDLVELREQIRLALDGTINETVTVGADSVLVQEISMESDREDFVKPKDASDGGMYHLSQDYFVFVPESSP